MARRIVAMTTLTPTATADTTNLVDATYPMLLQGGSATQVNWIWEVSVVGQAASSSSPTFMLLSADSTVATGTATRLAGQTDAPLNPATAALGSVVITSNQFATTKPQRSATLHYANCSVNAFGGVYFWRANRLEECFVIAGNAAPATGLAGEVSLSAFTGGTPGAIGAHIIYESA
jgi:hypothetical protein